MPELSAAPSINDTRTQALLVLIARLAALDLTTLLVYRIDSVVDGGAAVSGVAVRHPVAAVAVDRAGGARASMR